MKKEKENEIKASKRKKEKEIVKKGEKERE